MDWIREWILQIIGVIILGTVCDIIMVEGEMKKYVKPILGFVLVLTMIRPVTALSKDRLRLNVLWESVGNSAEIIEDTDKIQQTHIIDMYQERLGTTVADMIRAKYGFETEIAVFADRETESIGAIERVEIKIKVQESQFVSTESIKRYVADELGIDDENVFVTLKER